MKLYKLFSDGNYFPRAKKSGFGGYIQDEDGDILVEYTEQIKIPQYAYSFELLGIIRGLQIARSMGVEHIHSHCDALDTVAKLQECFQLGNTKHIPEHAKPELYQQILDLSKDFKSVNISYIERNLNKHSDALSRRYSMLMEKNYLQQFTNDMHKGNAILSANFGMDVNEKKIFFSHPALTTISFKNNPFLVAQYRNRKIRRISKAAENDMYDCLFIETHKNDNIISYKAFYYDYNHKDKEPKLITELVSQSSKIEEFCEFFSETLEKIKSYDSKKLWIYSNSTSINNFFEHKDKILNKDIDSFRKISHAMNGFENILYHTLPLEHKYSPELVIKEKVKKNLGDSIQSIDSIMENIQLGNEDSRKKHFGMLVKFHLKNYREVLQRDLSEIEKQAVILQATEEVEAKGLGIKRHKR